jgi:hypothetical protein
MKTLVIHPEDYTTRFLGVVYEGRDWNVITTNTTKSELKQQIKSHDRIVMLGHGFPSGLLGFGRVIINQSFIPLLEQKSCVCVWCNADKFVTPTKIKGFYTGMIISELQEAAMFDVEVGDEELLQSNWKFSYALRDGIDSPDMLDIVKSKYVGDTPIYNFNKQRLYSNV